MSRFSPLAVLTLSATLLMLGVGMIVALLPQRVYATTGTLESVGLVAAVFALAYLLAQLPVAILSDRLGAWPFLVTGYLLCALSPFGLRSSRGLAHALAVLRLANPAGSNFLPPVAMRHGSSCMT